MQFEKLTLGWRAIARASERSLHTLIKQQQAGTLPIDPLRIGHHVAATPEQIELLRRAGK